jgi:Ca2+-binding EF-hand superfamily protein
MNAFRLIPEMRSKSLIAIFVAVATSGCATHVRHWSPVEKPRPEDWHPPGLLLLRYDANNDGVVTRRELEAGIRQDFWQADTKHNGCLDADEVLAYNMRQIRINQSTATPLIDWNHDGCIDFNEFAAPMRSLFEEFDVNGDGKVTLEEMHLRMPKKSPSTP